MLGDSGSHLALRRQSVGRPFEKLQGHPGGAEPLVVRSSGGDWDPGPSQKLLLLGQLDGQGVVF